MRHRINVIRAALALSYKLLTKMNSDIQALNDQIAKNNSDATAAASEIADLKTTNSSQWAEIVSLTAQLAAAPSAADIQAATAAAKTTSDTLENAVTAP